MGGVSLDLLATRPQYRAHLEPVWAALPAEVRGSDHPTATPAGAVLVSSWQDLGAARRAGYGRIAYLEHGIGQTYGPRAIGYPGGLGREAIDLFLSPNETAAAADHRAYPRARVVVVGDPALERLPQRPPGLAGPVALSFHWDCHIAPETRSALPHYRDALAGIAARWPVIGHGHPRADELPLLWRRLGVEREASWHNVVQRASVYVCDNSSTLYEFAAAGGPVVVLNAPWFRREVQHGLRFWPAASVGIQVDHPDELDAALERAMADPPEVQAARQAALGLVYAHRGGAAARAATALQEWLS